MNKSITAFVMGLIFSLMGAALAYIYWVVFALVGAFSSGAIKTICTTVPLINMAVFIVAFIGSFFCLKKLKIGGLILVISSILSLVCFIIISVALKTFSFTMLLCWLPAVFVLVAGILALKKNNEKKTIS